VFDIIIKSGWIIDGTGASGFTGDVGIKDGVIAFIDRNSEGAHRDQEARVIINADGKIVCPGFIDMHSHGDFALLSRPDSPDKVSQGITTQTTGHCGFSAAPATETWKAYKPDELLGTKAIEWEWKSFEEWLSVVRKKPLCINIAPFVGYAPIRVAVMGTSGKPPAGAELAKMCELVEEAMDAGAFGFTTGLAYPPQCQATTEELAALCKVVARYGGLYATHVRDNTYNVASGIREAIEIGIRSGVRVHIAHLQIRPNPNCSVEELLTMMDEARKEGVQVTCDQYPYLAGQGPLTPLFPAWALEGGPEIVRNRLKESAARKDIKSYMREVVEQYFKWNDIILWSIGNDNLKGRSIQTLAYLAEKDPRDLAIDLLLEYGLSGVSALYFGKTEDDLRAVALWPHAMVGTDGIFCDNEMENHPRTFGTFPRMLRKYVREDKAISFEEAIYKMTGLPAKTLGLTDRGTISQGKKADIVVFDPENVADTATYEAPTSKAAGIEFVIVNGNVVKEYDEIHHISAGEVLHRI